MSDRGYLALALEIEAKAIECRVKGMEAENAQRIHCSASMAYGDEHFYDAENKLKEIAEKVRKLA